jgi:flagellar FliJ protein
MSQAIEFLLEQAKEKEEQAVLGLTKSRSDLEEYYQQLSQIEQYRIDYCNQLIDRGKGGLSASEYGHLNRFLTQLDNTLSKQKEAESHFIQQVTQSEQLWLEMRKQRRSYEWMLEKKATQAKLQADKAEQKLMDEFSTLSYARQLSR